MEVYLPHVQDRIARALGKAGLVLVTHEHPDHEGALVAQGGPPLLQAARLVHQQPPGIAGRKAGLASTPAARIAGTGPAGSRPRRGGYSSPQPHTRITDDRASGQSAGVPARRYRDLCAKLAGNARPLAPGRRPPRQGGFRREVFSWLRTITALKRQAPGLVVLPVAIQWVTGPDQRAPVRSGFSLGPVDPAQR